MNAQIQNDEFAVVLLNEEGTIIDAHESSREALGWDRTELQGKDIREVLQVGRDLVVGQLLQLQEEDASASGHTSFSVRVLARRKDESHFPARVTVRRFTQLGCWTAAFYRVSADSDTDFVPNVRPEEIELASNTPVKKPDPAPTKKADSLVEARREQKPFRSVNLFMRKPAPPAEEPAPAPAKTEAPAAQVQTPLKPEINSGSKPPLVAEPKADNVRERAEKERELAQTVATCARISAELEKERAERKRNEQRVASLSEQLQQLHRQISDNFESDRASQNKLTDAERKLEKVEEELSRSRTALKDEQNQRELSEQQLSTLKELNGTLETDLAAVESSFAELQSSHEELTLRFEAKLAAIAESESRLEKELLERQRLENALSAAQREVLETNEKNGIERSRRQLAAESEGIERKRLEQEVLRSRLAVITSARENGAVLIDLREKARQPVDDLAELAAKLLESAHDKEQKQSVEKIIESVLVLKTALDGAVPMPEPDVQAEPEIRAA
jgi:PAS domain S-box-containing protein